MLLILNIGQINEIIYYNKRKLEDVVVILKLKFYLIKTTQRERERKKSAEFNTCNIKSKIISYDNYDDDDFNRNRNRNLDNNNKILFLSSSTI